MWCCWIPMAYHSASYRSSAVTGNVLHYALAIQLNRFRMTLRSAAGVRPCTGRTPAVFSVPLTLRLLCCMACCQYGHFGACKLIAARWLSRRLSPTFGAAPQVTPPTSGAQLAFQRRSFSGARISRSTELMHVILDYNARSHMADTPVDTVFDAPQHQSRFTRPAASVCHALRYRHASTLQTAAPRSALHRSTMDGRPCTLHTTCAAQYPQSQPGLCPHFRLPIYCHTTLFHYLHLNSRTFFPPCHSLACTFLKFDVAISVFRGTICVLLTLILFCGAYRRTIPGGYHEREHPPHLQRARPARLTPHDMNT